MKSKIWIALVLLMSVAGYGVLRMENPSRKSHGLEGSIAHLAKNTAVPDGKASSPGEILEESKFNDAATLSKLPIILIGTIVRPNPKTSQTTLRITKEGSANQYQTDEMIGQTAKIQLIARDRIYFINSKTGKNEFVQFGPFDDRLSPSAAKIDSTAANQEFQLQRTTVDQALANLPKLLSEARAVPVLAADGTTIGFQILDISKGSVFEKLGFISGDRINAVEGQPIKSVADALQLFNQLRSSSMINLSIERNGMEHKLTYLIR